MNRRSRAKVVAVGERVSFLSLGADDVWTKCPGVLEDFHTITPHLTVRGVDQAVKFYEKAFGAAELYRNVAPDGKSSHACRAVAR